MKIENDICNNTFGLENCDFLFFKGQTSKLGGFKAASQFCHWIRYNGESWKRNREATENRLLTTIPKPWLTKGIVL